MKVLYQIYSLTQSIWLFPPAKQLKSRYFVYFMILPAIEAVNIINHYFHHNLFLVQNLLSLVSLISVLEKKLIYKIWPLIPLLILCIAGIFWGNSINDAIFILLQAVILGVFLKQFALKMFNEKIINVFILLLVFYEITVITKTLNIVTGFMNADYYYIITSIFDIIIGIFFCIFQEDSEAVIMKLD